MTFDLRMTELMAIAASVTANCQTCVTYHIEKATAAGAESSEIARAVEIGRLVRRGAAAELDHVVESILQRSTSASSEPAPGGGCSGRKP